MACLFPMSHEQRKLARSHFSRVRYPDKFQSIPAVEQRLRSAAENQTTLLAGRLHRLLRLMIVGAASWSGGKLRRRRVYLGSKCTLSVTLFCLSKTCANRPNLTALHRRFCYSLAAVRRRAGAWEMLQALCRSRAGSSSASRSKADFGWHPRRLAVARAEFLGSERGQLLTLHSLADEFALKFGDRGEDVEDEPAVRVLVSTPHAAKRIARPARRIRLAH